MESLNVNTKAQRSESTILATHGIYKKYPGSTNYVNKNINLSIEQGQICGLLGPNGAGKTTFVRQVCGLLRPTAGRVEVAGIDIAKQKNYSPHLISYLGQIAYAHRALKILEFIQFTGIYRGLSPQDSLAQARELLDYFNMRPLENRLMAYLSGGERRIVSFIAAILGYNPLIVLDEPTNDMDPEKRILLWQLVKELKEERGISFLLVTHNVYEASDVVDTVAIMKNGEIIREGVPSELADSLNIATKIKFSVPYDYVIPEKELKRQRISRIDEEHCQIEVKKENVHLVLNDLYSGPMGKFIRDIKITPPSLEDIYISNIHQEDKNEK